MPQVEIVIGGRSFEVACQAGEEPYLISAAQMLDIEASALSAQIGRMPEARMLLMAGLMLADKTAGLEDRLREAEAQIGGLNADLAEMPRTLAERIEVIVEVPVEVIVEVPVAVLPEGLQARLIEIMAGAEAMADAAEARLG